MEGTIMKSYNRQVITCLTMLLSILGLWACGGGGNKSSELPSGTLTGYVYKAAAGAPATASGSLIRAASQPPSSEVIPGAKVKLEGTNLSAISDETGRFEINGVPPGLHTIIMEADLDSDGEYEYSVILEGINLPHDKGLHLGWLKLSKTGEISGTVTLEGAPTGNLGIMVFIPGTSYLAITDDAGNYVISWVPAGTHDVAAIKDGYCAQTVDGIEVVKDQTTAAPAMYLSVCSATGDITGFAYLSGQTDHSGIVVEALNTAVTGLTVSDGSWTITGLDVGVYQVRFSKAGYNPVIVNNVLSVEGVGAFIVGTVYLSSSSATDSDGDGIPDADDPDDDNDGFTDAEEIAAGTDSVDPNSYPAECNDGVDNDDDTFVDYPFDPGCSSATDTSERGTDICDNGLDDDGDTASDYPSDAGCSFIADGNETTIWYVDIDATGANTGRTWSDAFNVVQGAADVSGNGDMIWVAEGIYTRPIGGTESVLTMKDGVDVYGGFSGTELTLNDRGDPSLLPSILDGENMSYHVVVGASNSILDGFTVTRGNAIGSGYEQDGGGMFNFNTTNITITNCIFDTNHAKYHGGAMHNIGSSVTITDSIFRNNTAINTVFNKGYGGAIHNIRTFHIIRDSLFDNNYADATAGAIYNWDNSNGEITNCTFTNNTGMYSGAGAVRNYDSSPLIKNCIFTGNYSGIGGTGGAISNWNFNSSIENCLFYNNTSNYYGGAIEIQTNGMNKIINCTIVNNNASSRGGGIYIRWDGVVEVTNTIIWGNTASSGPQILVDTGTLSVTNSDIQGGWTGVGNINATPLFSDSANFNFRLDAGSSCIDTGTDIGAPATDLDGNPRPAGLGYDMGAYEYQP